MTTIHEPAVDALDPDAPAAVQLAKDAPRAHVARTDGCTYIRFDSRDDFRAACDSRVIHLDNPFLIRVVGAEVVAPVLFGHGGQWRWQAEARYPAQRPCDCAAEVVHQLGCSATEYPEQWMFAGLDEIPVVVVDIPREACSYCGGFVGAHKPGCTFGPLPRRIPGAAIVHELLPNEYDGFGGLTCDAPFTGSEPATTVAADVTCPDCLRYIKPTPTLAVQAREHAERRTALVPPTTRFLRDAYSDVRAAEARELASEVAK